MNLQKYICLRLLIRADSSLKPIVIPYTLIIKSIIRKFRNADHIRRTPLCFTFSLLYSRCDWTKFVYCRLYAVLPSYFGQTIIYAAILLHEHHLLACPK